VSALNRIFQFNEYDRDRFIADAAETIPTGSKVLDAGAGPCKYKPLFGHCDYFAQDFGLYEGKEHAYGELDYVGDITSIPVPDNEFDCVLCTEVLEHLSRPELAIREFGRIIRPGGTLIITAPLISGIHMAPYHYHSGFSPYWYQLFLPLYEFELESCQANGGFFKFYGQESRRFLSMLTPENQILRLLFLPLKVVLAVWFRLVLPVACHFLDRFDSEKELTVGYFVLARKMETGKGNSRSSGRSEQHGDLR